MKHMKSANAGKSAKAPVYARSWPADQGAVLVFGIALIVCMTIAAYADRGALTWAFNAVAYMTRPPGYVFALAVVAGMLWVARRAAVWERAAPLPWQTWLWLLVCAAGFLLFVAMCPPWFPTLEGDGSLVANDVRLRERAVRLLMKLTGLPEHRAIVRTWWVLGIAYIVGAIIFVRAAFSTFWERITALLLFALNPAVASFTGHYDAYGMMYFCASAFLGCAYCGATRTGWRRALWLTVALVAGAAAALEHRMFLLLLTYPGVYWMMVLIGRRRAPRALRIGALCAVVAVLVCAGHWMAMHKGYGKDLFTRVSMADGMLLALYHPLILIFSFALPWLVVVALVALSPKGRKAILADPLVSSASVGSLAIMCGYYTLQIRGPLAAFGVLDFVSQAGCFGGLLTVPLVVALYRTGLGRHAYVVICTSVFLTVPAMLLHAAPEVMERALNVAPGERSQYYADMSPYIHMGLKMKDVAVNNGDSLAKEYAYAAWTRGANDAGFYANARPANLAYLIAWQYEFGDVGQAHSNLVRMLRTWPEYSGMFLYPRACFTTHSPLRKITEATLVAAALQRETRLPVYAEVIRACNDVLAACAASSNTPAEGRPGS